MFLKHINIAALLKLYDPLCRIQRVQQYPHSSHFYSGISCLRNYIYNEWRNRLGTTNIKIVDQMLMSISSIILICCFVYIPKRKQKYALTINKALSMIENGKTLKTISCDNFQSSCLSNRTWSHWSEADPARIAYNRCREATRTFPREISRAAADRHWRLLRGI